MISNPIKPPKIYGQKSNLRSKVFINTLYTKSNNSISRYINNFATSLCADFAGNSPPSHHTPPVSLPHKMCRFKYYVLFHDDNKNSPTKSNEVYELCDPTINLSILLQTANYANVCGTYITL